NKLIKIINSIKKDKYISDIPIFVISSELKDDDFRKQVIKKGVTLYTKNDQDISKGCLLNIISLYKSNTNLLKETKYIRRIWNTSKNINIIIDEKLNIIDFNNTAKRKFEFIDTDMKIREFISLMDIEDNQKLSEHLDYSLDIFGDISRIYIFRYENQYYKVNVRFLNKANHYLIAFDDITSLHKQKKDNEKLHQKHIQDLEESKEKMITIFTHELKTPLNGILGYSAYISRTLEKKALNEKKIDKLSSLSSEITALGHVLLSTINSLVDISMLKDNKLKVTKTSTNIEYLINNIVDVYKVLYKKDIDVNLDIKYINTDTKIIKDIFENIFSNALKYGRNKIIISLKGTEKDKFSLIVEDDGEGIPENKKEQIFQALEQGEAEKITRDKEGIGLGLTLVHKLSLLMGYEISVLKSETLGGAKFVLKGEI
ncbi:MAG: HAMP domain-containing sensor histidine kinase, partial [Campylobacterota bacterium]|nr:HAMP domain-containing sensor histidine kinase [Campylobacterota bacterium]